MHNVMDIADYFNSKYRDINIHPTMMQLLSLCYLAQAWNLGINEKPLFKDQIQKWTYGMVIPELYSTLKVFGPEHIDLKKLTREQVTFYKEEVDVLNLVFSSYYKLESFDINIRTKDQVYDCTDLHEYVDNNKLRMYYSHFYNSIKKENKNNE